MEKDKKTKKGAPAADAIPPPDPNKTLWGQTYAEAARRSGHRVPLPIKRAVEFLHTYGLDSEGLFRVPGSVTVVNQFRDQYDRGGDPVFQKYQVEDVASIILNFIRNSEDGILGDEKDEVLAAVASKDIKATRAALRKLPLANRETVALLVELLAAAAKLTEKNKMTIHTLGICFGGSFAKVLPYLSEHPEAMPRTIVYGVPLDVAAKRSDPERLIPSPIRVGISTIEKFGMTEELIYQESGSFMKIKYYQFELDNGADLDVLPPEDINCAPALITTFFRDMPNSLFETVKEDFKVVSKDYTTPEEQVKRLKELLSRLPKSNQAVIGVFSRHLKRVAEHPKNKMTIGSLAGCLGRSFSIIFVPLITHSELLFDSKGLVL